MPRRSVVIWRSSRMFLSGEPVPSCTSPMRRWYSSATRLGSPAGPSLDPYHLLEQVTAHRSLAAFGHAIEPVCFGADAAIIVALALRANRWRESRPLDVIGIAAAAANRQSLQQPTWTLPAVALRCGSRRAARARLEKCHDWAGTAISIHSSRGPTTRCVALGTGRAFRRIERNRSPAGTTRERPSTARPI